jgi:hypothetical protein
MIVMGFSVQGKDIIEQSIVMASVIYLHIRMQEENSVEHTNARCHLFTLQSTCRHVT